MIHGSTKLTESEAICRYIMKKFGKKELLGKDGKDSAQIDCILGVWKDILEEIGKLFFDPEIDTKLTAALEKCKPKLDLLQKFYGERDNALGYLTYVDFVASERSAYIKRFFPEEFKNWSFLEKCHKTIESLP
eukprot:GHVR01164628.1.p1 GENE.GHVR01164628.1~~GHVR01164628.1.p1  ORF type:complete len:133 (-),score=9.83 GHVR01164628.1:323-721(-)